MIHLTTEQAAPLNGQSPAQDASPVAHSRMDQTLKAKWIEALRSGNYIQRFHNVGSHKTLCCVGVGGVVAGLKPDGGRMEAGWLAATNAASRSASMKRR